MAELSSSSGLASFQRILNQNRELPQTPESAVHQLIHERAEKQPDAEAICSWDGSVTYSELDSLSSRLASHLADLGVGPEVIVPLCFEKSLFAVVSMLAILKAGGALLPFEISQPIARLKTIVDQTRSKVAVASPQGSSLAAQLVDQVVIVNEKTLEQLGTSLSTYPAEMNNMAYIIFTSGTTGIPKGVMIEHGQIVTTVVYMGKKLGHPAKLRAFQFGSYAFDSCITDILPTLIYGGTVCIPSEWERDNDVSGALRRMNVTLGKFTPSLAGSIVIENVPTLKTLVLGGESVPPALIEEWAHKLKLMLVYGPTECSAICFHCNASDHKPARGEIGLPVGCIPWIAKQDNWNELAEFGEAGELLIEGPLVGRGYLHNPTKTDEVFIRNPAWLEPLTGRKNSRLYRTGDLARYLDDGRVCYAGRIDNQVKIRGQRVELEGVEKKLQESLAEMGDAERTRVVVETTTPAGLSSKHLVAFLCRRGSGLDTLGALEWDTDNSPRLLTSASEQRRFLDLVTAIQAKLNLVLPSYAVPTIWIPVREIPLLQVSTKANRKLLRAIISPLSPKQLATFTTIPSTHSKVELTENEAHLKHLWAEVFGIPPADVEADDNFFSLGGDSVMAMRLVSIARKRGSVLTVNDVFSSPTLREMASTLRASGEAAKIDSFALLDDQKFDIRALRHQAALQCDIIVEEVEDIYPCSEMQLHYATGYPEAKRNVTSEPWNWQSQVVFSVPSELDMRKFQAVWKLAIRRYESLRTRLINTPDGILQVVVAPTIPVLWTEEDDLDKYLDEDKSPRRKMGFGDPLLRFATARSGDDKYFVMTAQHIIYDAFSWNLLFNEIEAAYVGTPLEVSSPSLNHFIKYITTSDKQKATDFWTAHLADADTKPLAEFQREKKAFDVKEELITSHIPELHVAKYTLPTMIEVAAALAIASKTGGSDIIFYSDRLGRNLPVEGIQDLKGPTTLFLPVRVHIDPDHWVDDVLRQAQDFQKAMIPHEHLGWLELRKMPHLKETLKHSINININPHRFSSFGQRLGLRYKSTHELCDDPFGLNVGLSKCEIKWGFYYSESLLSREMVVDLLQRVKTAFHLLGELHLRRDMTVGDILDSLPHPKQGDPVYDKAMASEKASAKHLEKGPTTESGGNCSDKDHLNPRKRAADSAYLVPKRRRQSNSVSAESVTGEGCLGIS